MKKASINGPNRRRNRAGDTTLVSNPLSERTHGNDNNNNNSTISFRIKSLETAPAEIQQQLVGNHSGLVACGGPAGKALLKQHQQLDVNENDDLPILIHFHEIPVLVLTLLPIDDLKGDSIYLSEVHRHNHKVCEDYNYSITCCSSLVAPAAEKEGNLTNTDYYDSISAVHVEISLRNHNDVDLDNPMLIDAKRISQQIFSSTYRSVLTLHELVLLGNTNTNDDDQEERIDLVCRIADIRLANKDKSDETSTLSLPDAILDDPFRGRVVMDTDVYVSVSVGSSAVLNLIDPRPFPRGQLPSDVVHVTTQDGEWFPVRRLFLAPCISLTHCVQAGRGKYKDETPTLTDKQRSDDAPTNDGCPHCVVQVDCHTFDRVLIYLASLLYPKAQKFVPELSEINALASAATELRLQSLSDLCAAQVSTFDSRVRKKSYIPASEVFARNEKGGELLLIMDGMVLDITRWLDEHPGGPSIIPTQALNVDATVFFEMYHVSRQAFVYLKSFYIGELRPEDYAALQQRTNKNSAGKDATASDGFLQSLRSFTKEWRVEISEGEAEKIHTSL